LAELKGREVRTETKLHEPNGEGRVVTGVGSNAVYKLKLTESWMAQEVKFTDQTHLIEAKVSISLRELELEALFGFAFVSVLGFLLLFETEFHYVA
jgi:hypothetical protein